MFTGFTRAVAVAACVVALGACSEEGSPVPTRTAGNETSGTAAPTTTKDDTFGAPPIENPLDASKQLDDPCSSLSKEQQAALGLGRVDPGREDSIDPFCSWRDAETDLQDFTVAYLVANENGLTDIYRGQEQGQWTYFQPVTVNGYPGAFADVGDRRDRGACKLAVGINEDLHFSVFSAGADPSTACDQVKEIAAAVIDTLKKNGG